MDGKKAEEDEDDEDKQYVVEEAAPPPPDAPELDVVSTAIRRLLSQMHFFIYLIILFSVFCWGICKIVA